MKKEIFPKDSRYVPLTQQRWSCVPTCVQMVMIRHKIPLVPAELLGHYFGLLVPKKDKKYFWNVKTGPKPKAGYGTQLYERDASKIAFRKLNIPLKMDWKLIDEFKNLEDFEKYLAVVEKSSKDILVCFDWGTLFDDDYRGGHVCVIDRVYPEKGELRLVDPSRNSPKWRLVKMDKLYKAMKYHGPEKSGGFWELEVVKGRNKR